MPAAAAGSGDPTAGGVRFLSAACPNGAAAWGEEEAAEVGDGEESASAVPAAAADGDRLGLILSPNIAATCDGDANGDESDTAAGGKNDESGEDDEDDGDGDVTDTPAPSAVGDGDGAGDGSMTRRVVAVSDSISQKTNERSHTTANTSNRRSHTGDDARRDRLADSSASPSAQSGERARSGWSTAQAHNHS